MKGAVILIGLMVCASMTEASSARWANQVKTIQNRHFKTTVAKGMFVHKYKKHTFVHHHYLYYSI